MDQSDQIIKEFFTALPQETKAFIGAPSWREKILAVCQKYRLSSDQEEVVEFQVFLMLIALSHPSDFEENIVKKANLPTGIASSITSEVYNLIPEAILDYSADVVEGIDSYKTEGNVGQRIPTAVAIPQASQPQAPQNLPTVPEHHDLMKYYAGTEPIIPDQIDYSGPVPLKKKDSPTQPKLTDTPRYDTPHYNPGTDPYRESSR